MLRLYSLTAVFLISICACHKKENAISFSLHIPQKDTVHLDSVTATAATTYPYTYVYYGTDQYGNPSYVYMYFMKKDSIVIESNNFAAPDFYYRYLGFGTQVNSMDSLWNGYTYYQNMESIGSYCYYYFKFSVPQLTGNNKPLSEPLLTINFHGSGPGCADLFGDTYNGYVVSFYPYYYPIR